MKKPTVSKYQKIGGGAVLAAAVVVTGYSLRNAGAQSPATTVAPAIQSPAVKSAAEMQTAFAEVARVAEPAVVTITTAQRTRTISNRNGMRQFMLPSPNGNGDNFEEFFRQFRGGMQPNSFKSDSATNSRNGFLPVQGLPTDPSNRGNLVETGEGSGIIYDKNGLILTNAHVVEGADRVTVKLLDGREFKNAKVLGVDKRSDIAVVKIPITNAPSVTLGSSAQVKVGDWAIAVGNPYGLSNTLTVGVISAAAREVNLAEAGSLNDYLQTDASINPGNSGGPLLDIYGRVIGVNNAIYSRSGGNVGIGFAIPIDVAKRVAASLVAEGKVRRGLIGIKMSTIAPEDVAGFGLPANTKGVLVQQVLKNTPAEKAGVLAGDVITSWNGESVARDTDLQRKVTASPIGKPGTLVLLRNGKSLTLSVSPEEPPSDDTTPMNEKVTPEATPSSTLLGIGMAPLSDETRSQFKISSTITSGVVVTKVAEGSPADSAGIAVGDVIQRVGQTMISKPEDVNRAKDALIKGQTGDSKAIALYVVRQNGAGGFIVLHVGE